MVEDGVAIFCLVKCLGQFASVLVGCRCAISTILPDQACQSCIGHGFPDLVGVILNEASKRVFWLVVMAFAVSSFQEIGL